MAKEIILDFKINNLEQSQQLGDNLEKAARGTADLVGGLALVGAHGKTLEEMQKNFAKILGATQAVKGGIEAVGSATKLLGGPLTIVLGLVGAITAAFAYFTSNAADIEKLTEANERLNESLEETNRALSLRNRADVAQINQTIELLKLKEDYSGKNKEIAELEAKSLQKTNLGIAETIKNNDKTIAQKKEILSQLEKEEADIEDRNKVVDELNKLIVETDELRLKSLETGKKVELAFAKAARAERDEIKKTKEDEAKALDERRRKWQEFQNFRIQFARQIRDLEISLIEDAEEQEIAQINEKYNRLIEDTKRNEKILQKEKDKIIKLAEENRAQDLADIEKRKQAELLKIQQDAFNNAQKIKAEELSELENANEQAFQMTRTAQEREITAVQDKFFRLIELAKQHGEDTAALEDEQNRQIAEINKKYADAQAAEDLAKLNEKISNVEFFVSAASNLTQSLFEITNNLGKQDEKSQLERAKRQFKIKKAVDATEAGINTAKAITKAIGIFGPPIPPNFLGIAAVATAGLIGAAQIAAILSAKFEGGSISAGGASVGGGASFVQPQPTFNPQLTATGQDSSQVISAGGNVIRAYVVEQDITSSQARMRQILERTSI